MKTEALRGDTATDTTETVTAACQANLCSFRFLFSTTAGKNPVPGAKDGKSDKQSQLLQEGFTFIQAARILSYLSNRKRPLDIENVRQWLQLLRKNHVQKPLSAMAKCPIIIEHRAHKVQVKAAAVAQWMQQKELTTVKFGQILSKWPALLVMTFANLEAVEAWLSSELNWTSKQTGRAFATFPQLFGLSPANLACKLAWFIDKGCSNHKMSRVLLSQPYLMSYTAARNETQWSDLLAAGLTQTQVAEAVVKMPHIVGLRVASDINQAKLRFLVQGMGKEISELVRCPGYLSCSLFKRVGPRWAFHSLHCPGQRFTLSTQLAPKVEGWLHQMSSSSMDAECIARGMTRAQLYQEHTLQWQRGEGQKWNFEKVVKPSKGTAADDASAGQSVADTAPVDEPPA